MNETLNNNSKNPSLTKLWRILATIVWLVIALSFAAFFLIDTQLDYSQLQQACSGPDCNWLALSPAETAVLNAWGFSTLFYAQAMVITALIAVLVYWIIGILIYWRQSMTVMGWTISLSLFVIPINMIADTDNVVANYPELVIAIVFLNIIGSIIFFAFFLLFPNGQFVPRWSIITLVTLAMIDPIIQLAFNEVIFPELSDATLWPIIFAFFLIQIVFILIFQFYRYLRVSTPAERLQTKWVIFGFIVLLLGFPLWFSLYGDFLTIAPGAPRLLASGLGWIVMMLMTITLPVTIAISIMRFKLWNIDRIIRGSLMYALLTGTLLLIFFGSVVTLQSLTSGLLGEEQSQLIIVLSTLLVAALLNPARRRIQALIDRRFYRQKYDAQLAVSRFSATLSNDVEDIGEIENLLQQVLDETIQPASAVLWLREIPDTTRL